MREVWARRGLRLRLTVLGGLATLIVLLVLAVPAGRQLGPWLTAGADGDLRTALTSAGTAVAEGRPAPDPAVHRVRVLDISGAPADGGPVPALDPAQVRALKSGEGVTTETDGLRGRWLGEVVTAPDGTQRLVVVATGTPGEDAVDAGARWLLLVAVAGAVLAAIAVWLVVRAALRAVGRMRGQVSGLPPGRLLEVPEAHDEVRALAVEFNALLRRQEEVAARLRRFTGDAAHELRSPVASIRVQAEVAGADPDPELAQETLADVLADAERLSTLLDGLLALARSDAGESPPAEPVDLVTEARAAVGRLPEGGPRVRVAAAAPQAWAYAAPAEVELVLNNLLRNAVRYAVSEIVVSVLTSSGRARLVVDDDGPGVPPEHREQVFDRFYRVGGDRARESGGAGLGLALVAEAVRGRGGQVTVGDSVDGGARFRVAWPMPPRATSGASRFGR